MSDTPWAIFGPFRHDGGDPNSAYRWEVVYEGRTVFFGQGSNLAVTVEAINAMKQDIADGKLTIKNNWLVTQ